MGSRAEKGTDLTSKLPFTLYNLINSSFHARIATNQTQDGRPYILSMTCGRAEASERAQGYTFVAKSEFASVEDMEFYDNDCELHMELKKTAMTLQMGGIPLMVYFKPQVVVGSTV